MQVELGRGDLMLLDRLLTEAGEKALKRAKRARKAKDEAGHEAHLHMASHIGRVMVKLGLRGGGASPETRDRLVSALTRVLAGLPGVEVRTEERHPEAEPVEGAAVE